ncbi:MAG: FkbM family methyltransferase [Robiginitomaculum sp.]|nr:FkbM family methyltransferase [Robiginitomaculum sp.]
MAGFNPYFSIAKRLLRLRKKPIIAKRLGATWKLYPNDWIDNRLLIGRPFEREQLDFAKECIKNEQISVFFDCGANFGLYSVLLGVNAPNLAAIHAFEPVARTYSRLVTNLELNKLSRKATTYNYGLGAKAAMLNIAFDASSSGTATLDMDEKNNPKRHFNQRQQVEIRKFDSQFPDKNQRTFIKLDVEGHEAEALKGMESYLTNNECILQIELWKKNREQIETWLAKRGYTAFHNIHHDLYFKRDT